jgi:hypothetical protein
MLRTVGGYGSHNKRNKLSIIMESQNTESDDQFKNSL